MSNVNVNPFPVFEVWARGEAIVFTSAFHTVEEAAGFLGAVSGVGEFANSLLRGLKARGRLSDSQGAWLHRLATEAKERISTARPRQQFVDGLDLSRIVFMLKAARNAGKRFPRITLDASGTPVVLQLAGESSKHPGTVTVTDGGPFGQNRWFGRIDAEGRFSRGSACNDLVEGILRALAEKPELIAGQHGVATGRCCFCNLELTTKASRSVGYGPVCAEKFGLPWGATDVADEADRAAKEVQL